MARASQAEPAETEVVAVWQEAMVEMVAAQVVLEEKVVEAVVEAAAEERAAAVAASWGNTLIAVFSGDTCVRTVGSNSTACGSASDR